MHEITPPIIMVEDNDILMFDSVEEAEQRIEPVDAKAGDFIAYDAEGRLLRFDATHWSVKVTAAELEPTHASQLEKGLRAYLVALHEAAGADPTCNLACLVKACRHVN